jgi:hypothetical protein
MSVSFPASGSLHYAQDLEKVAGKPGIPLKDERFCIGPGVRLPLWYGRMSLFDVDRGPRMSLSAFLSLLLDLTDNSGQERRVRASRNNQQGTGVSAVDHIENLQRYLRTSSSLVPKGPSLNHFRIRHLDLQETNIVVSRSSDSDLHIVSALDWQRASILPHSPPPTAERRAVLHFLIRTRIQ